MHAFSMAETADFGILRMIVSEVDKAKTVLKENHFAVQTTEVVCFNCPNQPGTLASVLDILAREAIFIEYMYAFSEGETASIVIRPTEVQKCIDTLQKCDCPLVSFRDEA